MSQHDLLAEPKMLYRVDDGQTLQVRHLIQATVREPLSPDLRDETYANARLLLGSGQARPANRSTDARVSS